MKTSPERASRAVLFDLDGTLVDTAPDLGDAANHVRSLLGLPPLPDTVYRPIASAGARGLLRAALDIGDDHPDYATHRQALLDHYRANLAARSRPFDGALPLLTGLQARGLDWGIVTNKPRWLTEPLLAQIDLPPAPVVVCGDDVARAKPAPDSLLLACEQLRIDAMHCLYVGDDLRDIVAGNAAGMRTAAAAWGYLGVGAKPDHWQATHICESPLALLPLLER